MATLQELKTQITNANALGKAKIVGKGGTVADSADTVAIMNAIDSIPAGGGGEHPVEIKKLVINVYNNYTDYPEYFETEDSEGTIGHMVKVNEDYLTTTVGSSITVIVNPDDIEVSGTLNTITNEDGTAVVYLLSDEQLDDFMLVGVLVSGGAIFDGVEIPSGGMWASFEYLQYIKEESGSDEPSLSIEIGNAPPTIVTEVIWDGSIDGLESFEAEDPFSRGKVTYYKVNSGILPISYSTITPSDIFCGYKYIVESSASDDNIDTSSIQDFTITSNAGIVGYGEARDRGHDNHIPRGLFICAEYDGAVVNIEDDFQAKVPSAGIWMAKADGNYYTKITAVQLSDDNGEAITNAPPRLLHSRFTWDGDTTGLESFTTEDSGGNPVVYYKVDYRVLEFTNGDGNPYQYTITWQDDTTSTPKVTSFNGYIILSNAETEGLPPYVISSYFAYSHSHENYDGNSYYLDAITPATGTWVRKDGNNYIKQIRQR